MGAAQPSGVVGKTPGASFFYCFYIININEIPTSTVTIESFTLVGVICYILFEALPHNQNNKYFFTVIYNVVCRRIAGQSNEIAFLDLIVIILYDQCS